ncbi:unnamed protein product [Brassica napus]|uniref:(rape) hypothetical protein n=1 Tax=Brassica napus TaxID=3708 RepID=A0A816LL30_BRANA|nr:unnamed protein product [Brassica napus]
MRFVRVMVCNQFINFLLINEDFPPPPLTEATVYIWRQSYIAFLNGEIHLKGNRGVGEHHRRRLLPHTVAKSKSLIAVKIPGMTHPIGEPSFYLFGFIMYCSHSCESAERDNRSEGQQNFNGGVWEKATHKEARLDDLEALKLDKCSGSSLPMDFQDRLNTAGTDLLLLSSLKKRKKKKIYL